MTGKRSRRQAKTKLQEAVEQDPDMRQALMADVESEEDEALVETESASDGSADRPGGNSDGEGITNAHAKDVTCHLRPGLATSRDVLSALERAAIVSAKDVAGRRWCECASAGTARSSQQWAWHTVIGAHSCRSLMGNCCVGADVSARAAR